MRGRLPFAPPEAPAARKVGASAFDPSRFAMRLSGFVRAAALAFCAFAGPLAAATATEPIAVPKLSAHVVDLTGTLSAAERDSMEAKLRAFESSRGSQIAVLIVPSIAGETIEEFAGRVTDEWKLGRQGVDDGVLFVIAKQERRMRIHTGRGVQGALTDALSKRIISEIAAPAFRSADFAGGIEAAVEAIMKAIEGEALPPPEKKASRHVGSLAHSDFIWAAFFLVPVVAMVLRGLVGRFFGAGLTSGITGLAAWLIFGSLLFGVAAGLIAFLFTLFVGSGLASGVRPGSWGVGEGGFGAGGGFGGGGGFSGGGGSFDGGGSSGSW